MPDLLFQGGRVLTMDPLDRIAGGVAVRDGRIVAVGDSTEVANAVGPHANVVALNGRALIPGFCDPHNHFSMTTFEPRSVDCRTPPLAGRHAVLGAIAAAAEGSPDGRWIWGIGYGSRVHGELLRGELDAAAPHNPVCIMESSYHGCFVNSLALDLCGIDAATQDPAGGAILRDRAGNPTGVLLERAMDTVHHATLTSHLEVLGPDSVAGLVERNARRHLALGITSVGDAQVMPESEAMYRTALESDRLPVCIHQLRGGHRFFAEPAEAARGDWREESTHDRLRGGAVKIFMDPVLPGPALTVCHPDGRTEDVGTPYYSQEAVDHLVLEAASRGLQVAIHCIGNRAVEQALNSIERASLEVPRDDPRYRIEHFLFASAAQIQRAASLGVILSMQSQFFYASGETLEERRRAMGLDAPTNPFRSALDAGATVAAGSDSPCAPLDPLLGIFSAVTRKSRLYREPVASEEAIDPLEALRAYTLGSATAMFRDHEVGSIEVGKRADLVVLSHDPTAVDPDFIREIEVQQTYVDGELVFQL